MNQNACACLIGRESTFCPRDITMNEHASGSFADSLQLANDLVRAAKAFADRHVALVMGQESLGPECPFKKNTLLAMSEQDKLIRHIEQFVSGHFQQIEFQNSTADHGEKSRFFNQQPEHFYGQGSSAMNQNACADSATGSRLENLPLETKAAQELREIILVLRAASIPEDKVCAFVDRFCNGRKMYEA